MLEESKEGDSDRVNRGRVTDWCALAVNIAIEPLNMHEKVKVLAAAMSEAKKSGQAP